MKLATNTIMSKSKIKHLKAKLAKTKNKLREADRLAGAAIRQKEDLQDSQSRRNDWLRKAKRQAGYSDSVSFDVVWEETLALANLYKQQQAEQPK